MMGLVSKHVSDYLRSKIIETQKRIDKETDLRWKIFKAALSRLNSYYKQSTLATPDQLKSEIDYVIQRNARWLGPVFNKATSKQEVAQ
jgi:hypothetical protein